MTDAQNLLAYEEVKEAPKFIKKDWRWLADSNNGVYSSNQIQFFTNALQTSNEYVIWSEAYLVVPYTIATATSTPGQAFKYNPICFKNGYFSLIDRCAINLNNVSLSANQAGAQLLTNYRILTDWNQSSLKKLGPTLGFSLDTSDSGSTSGVSPNIVSSNNTITPAVPVVSFIAVCSTTATSANATVLDLDAIPKIKVGQTVGGAGIPANTTVSAITLAGALTLSANATATSAGASLSFIGGFVDVSQSNAGALERCKWISQTANANNANGMNSLSWASATNIYTYTGNAIIRLQDIHDIFRKMNMPIKNTLFQFYFYLNLPSTSVGTSNPLMTTDQNASGYSNAGAITLTVGGSLNQTRLYYPVVQMLPSIEKSYIGSSWRKVIRYYDHNLFQNLNIGANSSISWNISTGISNLRRLIFYGFVAQAGSTTSPLKQLTASEPATCSPGFQLSTINLQINGQKYYQNDITYDFEQYIHNTISEDVGSFAQEHVVSSGLINMYDWENQYRLYVFNVSRNPNIIMTPDVPVTILLTATNTTTYAVDLYCVAEFERGAELNMNISGSTMVLGPSSELH